LDKLKEYHPNLHNKALTGEITLRDTNPRPDARPERFAEPDFYNRIGRTLHNLFKHNDLNLRLEEIVEITNCEWCASAEEGISRLLKTFAEVQKELDTHVSALKDVQKKFAGVV
jgi:hypothetical protein